MSDIIILSTKNPATIHSALRETNSVNTFISISTLILSYHVGLQRSLPFITYFPIKILFVLFQVCYWTSVPSNHHSCVVFEGLRVLISIRKPSILRYKLFSISHRSQMLDRRHVSTLQVGPKHVATSIINRTVD